MKRIRMALTIAWAVPAAVAMGLMFAVAALVAAITEERDGDRAE